MNMKQFWPARMTLGPRWRDKYYSGVSTLNKFSHVPKNLADIRIIFRGRRHPNKDLTRLGKSIAIFFQCLNNCAYQIRAYSIKPSRLWPSSMRRLVRVWLCWLNISSGVFGVTIIIPRIFLRVCQTWTRQCLFVHRLQTLFYFRDGNTRPRVAFHSWWKADKKAVLNVGNRVSSWQIRESRWNHVYSRRSVEK